MDTYTSYIERFTREKNPLVKEIEQYAEENHVPIMDRHTIETFLGLLQLQNPAEILEIGSAIGYSAIRMAQTLPDASITTIEREAERYEKAVSFIEQANLQKRIRIIKADALEPEADKVLDTAYDALFIDAAKGQYKRFFMKYSAVLKSGGFVYCDNMFMRGLVLQDISSIKRRKRTMVRNLKAFTTWIMTNPQYKSALLPIGDGVLIAKKK